MEFCELQDFLNSHSSSKFYIEFEEYYTNHLAHLVIALYHLGSDRETNLRFSKNYIERKKLEGPEGKAFNFHESQNVDKKDEGVPELLGKRRGFGKLVHFYLKELHSLDGNLDKLISKHLSFLVPGFLGAAAHGLIHLGYGYSVKNANVVTEGLAYMHHSYYHIDMTREALPNLKEFGKGNLAIHEVFDEVRSDHELYEYMKRERLNQRIQNMDKNVFQTKVLAICERGNALMTHVHKLKLEENLLDDPDQLMSWTLDQVILAYLCAENRNDFFLLHGITSGWALNAVIKLIKDNNVKLDLVRTFILGILGLYIVQGRPKLDLDLRFEPKVDGLSWEGLVQEALKLPDNSDEHIFKLLHVCKERASVNKDNDSMYKRAVRLVLDHPFVFYPDDP